MRCGIRLGERDNLGPDPLMALLHAFRGIVKAGEEGLPAHRPDAAGLGIGDVNQPVARLELKWLFNQGRRVSHAARIARFPLNGELIQISSNCRFNDLASFARAFPDRAERAPTGPLGARSPFPMET